MAVSSSAIGLAQPLWLLALLVPALLWWLPQARRSRAERERLARYADPHLLPHLLTEGRAEGRLRRRLLLWTLLWSLGVLAMAGPRWGYREMHLHRPGDNLVILLDLSASMMATDVKPSRLARARQEIEDLLARNPGLRVGLVAFASVSHVVAPVTEDADTIRHLLPSISPELLRWQGSRLSAALEAARRLLSGQPPDGSRALVVVTDGDLTEPGLEQQMRELRDQGVLIHLLGVGTLEGAPVPGPDGATLKAKDDQPVTSRLDEKRLQLLAEAGGGIYQRADYRDADSEALMEAILAHASPEATQERTVRVWNERYDLILAMMMFLFLQWFRSLGPLRPPGRAARGG